MIRSIPNIPLWIINKNAKFFLAILLMIPLSFTSCAYQLEPLEKEARTLYYHKVTSVLVVPFLDNTENPGLSKKITEAFTEELARFREIGVIHAAMVYEAIAKKNMEMTADNLAQAGVELGREFGISTIILGMITEYDPYYPPKLGVSLEVVTLAENQTILATSETYDASFNYVRKRLDRFAASKNLKDSVYGNEIILRKQELFIRFVVHELIRRFL